VGCCDVWELSVRGSPVQNTHGRNGSAMCSAVKQPRPDAGPRPAFLLGECGTNRWAMGHHRRGLGLVLGGAWVSGRACPAPSVGYVGLGRCNSTVANLVAAAQPRNSLASTRACISNGETQMISKRRMLDFRLVLVERLGRTRHSCHGFAK